MRSIRCAVSIVVFASKLVPAMRFAWIREPIRAILGFSRKDFVETKEVLMQRSKDLAEKGKEGLYEEYVKPYRHV